MPVLAGAALFAFYPNHGETHFWLSSGPMNILSTSFVLAYALLAIAQARRLQTPGDLLRTWRLGLPEFLCFACAMFTYDQPGLMLVVLCALKGIAVLCRPAFRTIWGIGSLFVANAGHMLLAAYDVHLKLHPSYGPKISSTYLNYAHVSRTVWEVLTIHIPHPVYRGEFLGFLGDRHEGEALLAAAVAALLAGGLILAARLRPVPGGRPRRRGDGLAGRPAGLSVPPDGAARAGARGRRLRADLHLVRLVVPQLPADRRPRPGGRVAGGGGAWPGVKAGRGGSRPRRGPCCSPRPGSSCFATSADRPTAGLAVAVAWLAALNLALLRRAHAPFLRHLTVAALVGLCALYTFGFVGATVAEKKLWIESYQARKSFYAELAAHSTSPRRR